MKPPFLVCSHNRPSCTIQFNSGISIFFRSIVLLSYCGDSRPTSLWEWGSEPDPIIRHGLKSRNLPRSLIALSIGVLDLSGNGSSCCFLWEWHFFSSGARVCDTPRVHLVFRECCRYFRDYGLNSSFLVQTHVEMTSLKNAANVCSCFKLIDQRL